MRSAFLLLLAAAVIGGPSLARADGLTGTSWVLAGAGKRPPALVFEAGGKLGGSGGCNRFFGSYSQKGEALSLSALGATRMACASGIMRQEQAFFDMLGKVQAAKIEAETLVLLDGGGGELAKLSRRGAD